MSAAVKRPVQLIYKMAVRRNDKGRLYLHAVYNYLSADTMEILPSFVRWVSDWVEVEL